MIRNEEYFSVLLFHFYWSQDECIDKVTSGRSFILSSEMKYLKNSITRIDCSTVFWYYRTSYEKPEVSVS